MKIILKIFISVVLVVFLIWLVLSIKYSGINCVSQINSCSPEIVDSLKNVKSKEIVLATLEIKRILRNNILVSRYFIDYKYPSVIVVHVVMREARFAVHNIKTDEFYFIDKNGLVLSSGFSNSNLVALDQDRYSLLKGEYIPDSLMFSLNILNSLKYISDIKKAEFDGEKMIIENQKGVKYIFPSAGDRDLLEGSFVLINNGLNKSTSESKMISDSIDRVDLRFKNPIIIRK